MSGADPRGHARAPGSAGLVALTREVPASINSCELTHLEREPIDLLRARAEHGALEEALSTLGVRVRRLPPLDDSPDAVFVEDTAVVLNEVAVLARPGAAPRRAEVVSMEQVLREMRPVARIQPPATLDGGDVLVLDDEIVVGRSERTNDEGVTQLRELVAPFGYRVRSVEVRHCLHLKSAVTRVGAAQLLVNPEWVNAAEFPGWECIEVEAQEPVAANALMVLDAVIHPLAFGRTRARLERAGCRVVPVPAGELAKAEGGVTCCAVLVSPP